MRRSHALSVILRRFAAAAALVTGCAGAAAAQTVLTINVPKTQVVYTTLRGGSYANTNQGADLETKTSTDASVTRRGMLKFDTTGIAVGTPIASATLTVTVQSGGTTTSRRVAAYQVTQSWTETEATWNSRRTGQPWTTAGGDLGTNLGTQPVSNAAGAQVTFDVTALVSNVVSGALGSSRYTRIALVDVDPADGESRRIYYTPDNANASLRPTLTVTLGTGVAPPPPPPSGSNTLRVLEYNVHHGGYGTDGVYNPGRIIDWVVKLNPDVISFCEMEKFDSWVSGDGIALYKSMLEQRTGVTWYTWDIQDYGDWNNSGIRNAIFSRIPFSAADRYVFTTGRDRTIGVITFAVNGRNVNFFSTHFAPYSTGESDRVVQAQEMMAWVPGFAEDRIALGDFNDSPSSTPITTIKQGFYDGWAEAVKTGIQQSAPDNPYGYTHNVSRIDYVFYSRGEAGLTLQSIDVPDTRDANGVMPSDHAPLVATFIVQ